MSIGYKIFVVRNPPSKPEDIRQFEEEYWSMTMTPRKGTDETATIPSDQSMITTLRGPVLTSEDVAAWGKGALYIFFMGKAKYSNDNGSGAIDFCGIQTTPQPMVVLCLNHNGPSYIN